MAKGNYAFIDSQNLNLGIRSQGWAIDYKKFRLYLSNKYHVSKAFIFIGFVEDNQSLYSDLEKSGYILVFKPTVRYYEDGKQTTKGNVDAELVLHAAAIEYGNYGKAIVVSGDGDFHCLLRFLAQRNKLLHLMVPNIHFSKLLRDFSKYVIILGKMERALRYKHNKKSRDWRSVETLGLPEHGDPVAIIVNNGGKHKRLNKKSPSNDETPKGSSSVRNVKIVPAAEKSANGIKGQK